MDALTHEQAVALRSITPGGKILVCGAVGSGKSRLSLEAIRAGGTLLCPDPVSRTNLLNVERTLTDEGLAGAIRTPHEFTAAWLRLAPRMTGRAEPSGLITPTRLGDLCSAIAVTVSLQDDTVEGIIRAYHDAKRAGATLAQPYSNPRAVAQELPKYLRAKVSLSRAIDICQAYEEEMARSGYVDDGDLIAAPYVAIKNGFELPPLEPNLLVIDDAHRIPRVLLKAVLSFEQPAFLLTIPAELMELRGPGDMNRAMRGKHFRRLSLGHSQRLGFEYAEQLTAHMRTRPLAHKRISPTKLEFCEHLSGVEMFEFVPKSVLLDIANGVSPDRIAVCFRAENFASELPDAMAAAGVPTRWKPTAGPSATGRLFLALLCSASDSKFTDAFAGLWPMAAGNHGGAWRDAVARASATGRPIIEMCPPAMLPIAAAIINAVQTVQIQGIGAAIEFTKKTIPNVDQWDEVELEDLACHLEPLLEAQGLLSPAFREVAASLLRGQTWVPSAQPRVRVLRADESYGLDVDIMHIVGYSDGLFPISGSSMEAERALSISCLTRASQRCVLHHAAKIKWAGSSRWANYTPSHFLSDLRIDHPGIRQPRPGAPESHDRFNMSMR